MLRGEWRMFERRFVEGLSCLAAVDADPQAAWPDDRQIEEAAHTFRYERDLVASDEIISWLDRAGLTVDAWTDYLVRCLLHDRWGDRLHDLPLQHIGQLAPGQAGHVEAPQGVERVQVRLVDVQHGAPGFDGPIALLQRLVVQHGDALADLLAIGGAGMLVRFRKRMSRALDDVA